MNAESKSRQAVAASCGVEGLAHLKTFHHIPHFRIGGTYDLDDPSSWESGGTGGVTLESLGEGPLRTACIAVGTPHRDAEGCIDNAVLFSPFYSGDAALMYFLLVPRPRGKRLLRRPRRGPRGVDRHGAPLRHLPGCPRPLGRRQTERRARPEVPAIQHPWTASRPTTGCFGTT